MTMNSTSEIDGYAFINTGGTNHNRRHDEDGDGDSECGEVFEEEADDTESTEATVEIRTNGKDQEIRNQRDAINISDAKRAKSSLKEYNIYKKFPAGLQEPLNLSMKGGGTYPTAAHRDSTSSIDSIALKSTPATPHVTPLNGVTCIQYVAKHSTALQSVTGIIECHSNISIDSGDASTRSETQTAVEDVDVNKAQKFFNNMISSFSFKSISNSSSPTEQNLEHESGHKALRIPSDPSTIIPATATSTSKTEMSSSNKSSGAATEIGSASVSRSPTRGNDKSKVHETYNKKLYVDEKLKGTNYRFTTIKRNDDFHKIFKTIPAEDRLLDDFSCALSREFLYQGRIYITENHLCFNSNLLGWVTNLVIAIKDVTSFEKTSTVGLFPNGIAVLTKSEKHYFASFLSRDSIFDFLVAVQTAFKDNTKSLSNVSYLDMPLNLSSEEFFLKPINELIHVTAPSTRGSAENQEKSNIQDAILSVDYVTPNGTVNGSHVGGEPIDYYQESSDSEALTSDDELDSGKSLRQIFQLKKSSNFIYNGPHYYRETKFKYLPEKNNEYILVELSVNAPPGLVFEILFNEHNPSFIEEFLSAQDSTQISEIPGFTEVNPDGQPFRRYGYTKALNYPVGPKSTKVFVQETILHRDYEDYINVVNATKTPDVPSGNNFCVKTRYMFRWASPTTSTLKISFWVDWLGNSWIKSTIEKSCKSGQIEATKLLVDQIYLYMEDHVEFRTIKIDSKRERKQIQNTHAAKEFLNASRIEKENLLSASSGAISASTAVSETSTAVPSLSPISTYSWKNPLIFMMITIGFLLITNLIFQIKILAALNYIATLGGNLDWKEKTLDDIIDKLDSKVSQSKLIRKHLKAWDQLNYNINPPRLTNPIDVEMSNLLQKVNILLDQMNA